MICCITLHQIYYFTDRHCWFCFYHVMNMIFICLHISDNDFMLLTYLIRKLLYIIWYLFWHQQFLSILAYENNRILKQIFVSVFWFPRFHNASIAQTSASGYLNPPSKASGIAVSIFQEIIKRFIDSLFMIPIGSRIIAWLIGHIWAESLFNPHFSSQSAYR